ncbi:LexA family protein [Agrobacterium vitis]
MNQRQEQFEKEQRTIRLREAQERSNLGGYRKLANRFGWKENTIKGHLQGKSSFGVATGKKYAKAFGVSFEWLYFGKGQPEDIDIEPVSVTDVPLISMVSAGQLLDHEGITDLSDFPVIAALDLPEGSWIALRVEGDSMNRVSPNGSIIFVNRKDKRLSHNGCYVIADETGAATYKRYRQGEDPPFQPYSTTVMEPPHLTGVVKVVGRVRRSIIDL